MTASGSYFSSQRFSLNMIVSQTNNRTNQPNFLSVNRSDTDRIKLISSSSPTISPHRTVFNGVYMPTKISFSCRRLIDIGRCLLFQIFISSDFRLDEVTSTLSLMNRLIMEFQILTRPMPAWLSSVYSQLHQIKIAIQCKEM